MKLHRLGNYVRTLSGFAFKSELFNSEGKGLPLIRVRDVNSGFSGMYYSGEYPDEYVIDNGDILIGMDGDFNAVVWTYGKALLNQRVCKLVVDDHKLSRIYLLHYLPQALKSIHKKTTFTTVKHLSAKTIEAIPIPFPENFEDQIRIATVLTRAEKLIAKRKESIQALDEILKSTFLEMFGDVLYSPGNVFSLDELKKDGKGTFSNGPFGSDLLTSELNSEGGIPVIYIRDIRNGYLDWKSNVYVTAHKASQLPNCCVVPGDLLIAKVGDPPGISAVCDETIKTAVITQDVIRLRLDTKIANPVYLSYFINSSLGKKIIEKITVKGTRNRFPLGDLKKVQLKLPDVMLQKEFAVIVDKIESLKAKFVCSLTELENLYDSLSQRAFKGELDLSKVVVGKEMNEIGLVQEIHVSISGMDELIEAKKYSEDDLDTILKSQDVNGFTFESLMKDIEKASFHEMPGYEELKVHIYNRLAGTNPTIVQKFDVDKNEMILRLIK